MPDNLGRNTSGSDSAPQFTAFGTRKSASTTGGKGGNKIIVMHMKYNFCLCVK